LGWWELSAWFYLKKKSAAVQNPTGDNPRLIPKNNMNHSGRLFAETRIIDGQFIRVQNRTAPDICGGKEGQLNTLYI